MVVSAIIIAGICFAPCAFSEAKQQKHYKHREISIRTSSVKKAVMALGEANGIDLDLCYDRKQRLLRNPARQFRFKGLCFWQELAQIEQAFDINLIWEGGPRTGNIQPNVRIRLANNNPGVELVRIFGRYRVIVSTWRRGGLPPKGAKVPRDFRYVTLNFLPGERVLDARWVLSKDSPGKTDGHNSPLGGVVHLGTIPATKVKNLAGTVEIISGRKWKTACIDLEANKKVCPPKSNAITEIKIVRIGGTNFEGLPGSMFELTKENNKSCKAYVVEFAIHGPYKGLLPCKPDECGIIDNQGITHTSMSIGTVGDSTLLKSIPGRFQAIILNWKTKGLPAKFKIRVPTKMHKKTINIGA